MKKAAANIEPDTPLCFTTIASFLGNDPSKHKEHLSYFVKHGADLMANLHEHATANDRSHVRSVAHQYKAVATSIGALELSRHAVNLEKAAEESDWAVINEYIRQMTEEYQLVVDFIKQRYS